MKKITLLFLMFCTCTVLMLSSCSSGEGDNKAEAATETENTSETAAQTKTPDDIEEDANANTDDYLGNWSYTIKGTPMGDFSGTLSFNKNDEGYSGVIMSEQGTLPLEDFKLEGNQFEGKMKFEGNPVTLSGSMKGNSMIGKTSSMGFDFKLEGTKE